MRIHLKVWRQAGPSAPGRLVDYTVENVSPDMSFLEMLDVLNEGLIAKGEDPVAFDSDCREGICGTCGFLVDGVPHGPDPGTTVCQLHMRRFSDNDRLTLEPWRARAFPLIKDLVVDRSSLRPDHPGRRLHVDQRRRCAGRQRHPDLQEHGRAGDGFRGVHRLRRLRRGLQECLGCPVHVRQGQPSRPAAAGSGGTLHARDGDGHRHDAEGFGSCSNEGECEAVCPKEIPIVNIARMNRDYFRAMLLIRD